MPVTQPLFDMQGWGGAVMIEKMQPPRLLYPASPVAAVKLCSYTFSGTSPTPGEGTVISSDSQRIRDSEGVKNIPQRGEADS